MNLKTILRKTDTNGKTMCRSIYIKSLERVNQYTYKADENAFLGLEMGMETDNRWAGINILG